MAYVLFARFKKLKAMEPGNSQVPEESEETYGDTFAEIAD